MKTIAALLTAVLLAPSLLRAQVRVGAAAESGLGVTAAPAPAPTLSAPALSAATPLTASLSPSWTAPAALPAPAAVAARPVAAAAVAAAPASALAAIKPAAATPDKPGSEQARAAAGALFDGAVARAPAIGDGPSVPGAAPEDRRSSGLSPPSSGELAEAYRRARPKSKAVDFFGRDFVGAASEAVQRYTFLGEHFLQGLNPGGVMDFRGRALYRAAADLVETHDAREDAPSRRFMELLGRWTAFKDHAEEGFKAMMLRASGRSAPRNMPPSPLPRGEYWDMAAGMNAQGFIHRELDPNTKYAFFDYSPFVVSYLRAAAELAGADNARVVEGDINALTRPAEPLAVLRTKNAVHYVPGFDKKLETMADWIAPGGQLVIQNDPNPAQRSVIIDKHGPLIRRLLALGWEMDFGFAGRARYADYALDTVILTRPRTEGGERHPAEVDRAWKSYRDAVAMMDAKFNPLGFLFR